MRWGDPRLWLGALTAIAVLAIGVADLDRTSPGPLARVHAMVPELADGARCASCHGGWFSDQPHACLECHAPIARQLRDGAGLHGSFGAAKANGCGVCHGEHHGPDFALVNRSTWALAGTADAAAFDHRRIGFDLGGAHAELACAACHVHADDDVLAAGTHRYLGLAADCGSCHDDAHAGAMAARCDQCHGQTDWGSLAAADHDRHLPLAGGHAELACGSCHPPGSARDVLVLGQRGVRDPRDCRDCHDSPHRQELAAAATVAAPAGETRGASAACSACHRGDHATFAAARATMTPELHAATGFELVVPHADVACERCHAAAGSFAARHPGRDADACATCHRDPHGRQFAPSPTVPADCRACHAREQFAPHEFTAAMHQRTALPLEGRHAEIACELCHEQAAPDQPRRFRGVDARCDTCHADAHDGAFAAHAAALTTANGSTCSSCHDPRSFADAGAHFDHARFTPLPLDGAHAQAGCAACHPPKATADPTGRTFGRVRDEHGEFRGCVTCHDDPHAGRFDRSGLPRERDGRRDCARCHGTASFRALAVAFDHAAWTGFALHGAHGKAACTACHPATDPTAPAPAVSPPRGTECADCHQEPHRGQFAVGAVTDCRRCHRSAVTFADLTFRHDLDARFALGEAHQKVACARCHPTEGTPDHAFVRYRPLPRECTDCHEAQSDPLRRQTRNRGTDGGNR